MNLSQKLWEENHDLAQASLHHPFIQGLKDGSLPLPCFQSYIGQDACFLEAFARGYALALAHASDMESLKVFYDLLSGVFDELKMHGSYCEQWEMSPEKVAPVPATLAYTNFLLATAALGSAGETCAAMTPCMRLYVYLGQTLDRETSGQEHKYTTWIKTYAAPAMDELACRLEALVDRYAQDTPAIHAIYRQAMQLEWDFFEANLRTPH